MKFNKLILPGLTFLGVVLICTFFARDAIPNQEGYYEISWNLTYLDFQKYILAPQVTPLNYLLPHLLVKLTNISLHSAWKLLDMVFGGLTTAILVYLYQKKNPTGTISQKLVGPLLILGSLGLVYPLTSQTGEGLAVLTSIVGMYFWVTHSFILGAIFFLISYFSKYTIFLILPAVIIWTVVNWSHLEAKRKKKLLLGSFLFFVVALTYFLIKQGNDIVGQASYSSTSLRTWLIYIPDFIVALSIGGPIVFTTGLLYAKRSNLFWLGAASALLLFFTRYYYWHYPYQVLIFLASYILQSQEIMKRISLKLVLLQLVFTTSLYLMLPIKGYLGTIYPKHQTFSELKSMENIILSDYRGGKVGYYLNRPFNESYPAYEISYMDPTWRFQMEQTEYVIVPSDTMPLQLHHFPDCHVSWVTSAGLNSLYRVACAKQ